MTKFLYSCKRVIAAILRNKEVMRSLLFSLVISLGLMSENPLFYTLGLVIIMAWLSHLTRKIMFPYLDMRSLVEASLAGKTPSAIVFFSVCALMGVLMLCSTLLLG